MPRPKDYNARCFDHTKMTATLCAEMKTAFEDSFAVCFEINREKKKRAIDGTVLKRRIIEELPSAHILSADLCVMRTEPITKRDQLLVIVKNGTQEESSQLMKLLEESGIVDDAYMIFSKKKGGIKGCVHTVFGSDKPAIVQKANLLVDGDRLMLTVRAQTQADRDAIKAEKDSV